MKQTSLIPGEEGLERLSEERDELRSKIKPLLDLIKGNGQFLVKFAPFCDSVFFRSGHLGAAATNTTIAIEQADELVKATQELGKAFSRYSEVKAEIEQLLEKIDEATNGEFRQSHPEHWGVSTEQLDDQAGAFLKENGLNAATAQPALVDDDPFGLSDDDRNLATAI